MKISRISLIVLTLSVATVKPYCANSQNLDIDILKSINPQHPNSLLWTETSNSVYLVPLSIAGSQMIYGILDKDKQARQKSIELLLSVEAGMLLSQGMKLAVNRTRPQYEWPGKVFSLSSSNTKSFPSGHATIAFATATTLALQYKKWYVTVPAFAWATGVSYSRMYLGKHYPSDVLAGAAIGVGSAFLCHWLSKKIFKK